MKHKKTLSFIAAALIFAQLFLFIPHAVADGGRDVLKTTPPLVAIKSASFEAYDSSNVKVTDLNNIPKDAKIKIKYTFEVKDATDPLDDVKGGDFFTIALPSELTSISSFPTIINQEIKITAKNDKDEDEEVTIANLSINKDGLVTITFTEAVADYTLGDIDFTINGQFSEEKIGDETGASFSLYAGGTVYTLGFKEDPLTPDPIKASITKTGSYNAATNEITWLVTVNTGGDDITLNNVTVKDKLGDNQVYKSSNITPKAGSPIEGYYVFDLGSVKGETSFTVTTTPTDGAFGTEGSSKVLENDVELYKGTDATPLSTANAKVTVTTDWVQKKGVSRYVEAEKAYYIDWTITLNNNNRTIPSGATVTDTLPAFLALDLATVKRNGEAKPDLDSATLVGQEFTYTFGADAAGSQIITFTTKVHDDYFKQQNQTGFVNTGTLKIGEISYSGASGNVGVGTSLLKKSGSGYDASTKLITWQLEVNENGREITAATITDTITDANQAFYADFGVVRDGSVKLTKVEDVKDVTSAANRYHFDGTSKTLTIYLGNLAVTDKPTITFKTEVINPIDYANNKTTPYINTATLTGGGITSSISTGSQSVKSTVIAKASESYNYETRKLAWSITINQNNMNMPNAVVTDIIPQGQAYVGGSLKIDNVPSEGKLDSTSTANKLIINVGEISTQHTITFETVITDLDVFLKTNGDVTFKNDATLNSGITNAPDVSVYAERTVTNKAIDKKVGIEYTQSTGYIGWEVLINANQVQMQNAKLHDKLQDGLELDSESVKLYLYNQDEFGNRTVGNEVPAANYSFTYDYALREFKFDLPNGAQGYCLRFNTDVVKPGKYSNTISFTGSYSGKGSTQSGVTVTDADVLASGSGWNGSITVKKTDANGKPLEGAEFELLESTKTVKKRGTTGGNGEIKFDKLKIRTYYIRESKAPLGYALDPAEIPVILTTTADPATRNIHVNVENNLLVAAVSVNKTDKQGNPLSGGSFAIYNASDAGFSTPLKTVAALNGVIRFTHMLAGEYIIRELEAPSGYIRSNETISVTLTLNTQNNTLADVLSGERLENERKSSEVSYGSVEFQKVNRNSIPLTGAVFGIYDNAGRLISTTTSDYRGAVSFADVPFGEYTVKELEAPKGYKRSDIPLSVNILGYKPTLPAPNGFMNIPLGTLPQTGGFFDDTVLIILGCLLMLSGVAVLLGAKQLRKKR